MPIQVVCPGCQGSFRAKEESVGRKVSCPKCGGEIVISAAAPSISGIVANTAASNSAVSPAPTLSPAATTPPSAQASAAKPAAAVAKPMAKAKRIGEPHAAPHPPFAPAPISPPSQPNDIYAIAGEAAPPSSPPLAEAPQVAPAPNFAVNVQSTVVRPTVPAGLPPKRPSLPRTPTAEGPASKFLSPLVLAGVGAGVVILVLAGLLIFRGKENAEEIAAVEAAFAKPTKPAAVAPAGVAPKSAALAKAGVEEELADVVERLKTGIVLITLMDSRGETLGLGTGFIIDARGYAVTNHHVIKGGSRAKVRYANGETAEIRGILAADEKRDLAILQLPQLPYDAKPLALLPDANLRQGTKVIAIGHPRGLDYSVTEGIVSALRTTAELPEDAREFLEAPDDQQWIQTSAAISGGNSGGPLMLPDGRVIGINTWVAGGENLGFAGHVRHVLELQLRVGRQPPESLASYNRKNGGLDRASADETEMIAAGYNEVVQRADAFDWQPSSDENKEVLRQVAGGSAFFRGRGLMHAELNALGAKLAARSWDYEAHIKPLNDFAVDIFEKDPGQVIFFGKVVETFANDPHISRVQIIGRGYFVDVYDFLKPKVPRNVGATVLVMGMRPPGIDSEIQRVAAGIIVEPRLPEPPGDTTLRELRDFVHFKTDCPQKQDLVADPKRKFEQIKFSSAGEPQQSFTLTLNAAGQGFDAVRLPQSTTAPDEDMVWAVCVPRDRLGYWGLASIDGVIPVGVERYARIDDYQPGNLALPGRNETFLVHVSGAEIKDSRKHLLWFEVKDDQPLEITLTGVYRPRFPARPSKSELFASLGLPEVTSFESRRKQQVFSTGPFSGDAGDNVPTLTGTPLKRAEGTAATMVAGGASPSLPQPGNSASPSAARTTPAAIRPKVTAPVLGKASQTLRHQIVPYRIEPSGPGIAVNFGNRINIIMKPSGNYSQPTPAQVQQARFAIDWLREKRAAFVSLTPPADQQPGGLLQFSIDDPALPDDGLVRSPYIIVFDQTELGDIDVARIRAMPRLSLVAVRNMVVGDALIQNIAQTSNLQSLVIQNVPVGDDALRAVGTSRTLRMVMFDYTNVSNAGTAALKNSVQISDLSLRGTDIDNAALANIAPLFNLRHLDLSETRVTEGGLVQLVRLTKLESLSLNRLNISAFGLAKLKTLPALRTLFLDGSPMTDAMVTQLTQMQGLQLISITDSGATEEQIAKIRQALPNCNVSHN